jgi:hypothetical protein
MSDRPIIFSAPMVRALLSGGKTQTRRLATSPLRRCEVGDRLWVREAFAVRSIFSDVVEVGYSASERASHTEYVEQIPIGLAKGAKVTWPKARPSIHMPRWASRLTLIAEAVRVEPLQAISNDDAFDEGVDNGAWDQAGVARDYSHPDAWFVGWSMGVNAPCSSVDEDQLYRMSFSTLWNSLHTTEGKRWEDNPDVLALTFRVVRGNIDRLPGAVA